jgi:uncharacterized protein YdaU (DUF1376 family)
LSVVKTDIWMPVFIGDYLADTMHLSTEQHGAYLLLLFHLWRRGSLRDEDAVLAQISGLGESAWKQHRGVLAEFFRIQGGLWQHARVEKERARVAATTQSKAKKAKLAASSRWGKNDASSIAQAMLGDADSDSDSESDLKTTVPQRPEERPQVPPLRSCGAPVPPLRFAPVGTTMTSLFDQEEVSSELELLSSQDEFSASGKELLSCQEKSSSEPELLSSQERFCSSRKKVADSDARHCPFRAILAQYWRAKNHASPEMPWQGRDAKALSNFLAACPRLNETQFRQMVGNRARSAVAHGDRVYLWIANLTRFQEEITVYNKPASAGGGYASRAEINRNSVISAVDGALMLAQEHADRVGQTGAEPASIDDAGVPAADGPGPGRGAVALPGNGDHGVAAGHPAYGQTGTDGSLPNGAAVTTASQANRDGREEVSPW